MNNRIFISYSHKQAEWVFNKLVPSLRAGGANLAIDVKRADSGKALILQIDDIQDASDLILLVLTPDYLASEYCLHEMNRAIARDPSFKKGKIIPVLRIDCTIPNELKKILYVDLRDDQDAQKWDFLLSACDANIGASVPHWLGIRDEIVSCLNRGESVDLVVSGKLNWRALIENTRGDFLPSMRTIDLHSGVTVSQRGFIEELLIACDALNVHVPREPMDLVTLSTKLAEREVPALIAMLHFEMVALRRSYSIGLFTTLRDLVQRKKLILLIQSRIPLSDLPPNARHLVSISNFKVLELRAYDRSLSSQGEGDLRLQIISLAHDAANVKKLEDLDNIVMQLPEGKTGFLTQTAQLRSMVLEITKTQAQLDIANRPILRAPYARLLCKEIENFQHRISGFDEPLSIEFYKAANHWHEIAKRELDQIQMFLSKGINPQVFRAGDPVNRQQEAFVPRYGVVGDLEKQVMLATGCPGLVLYGRRRMGKSTILNNLNGFLPDTVVPVFVSMQDPQAFTSLMDWMSHLAQKLAAVLPKSSVAANAVTDLSSFMRVLSDYNAHLHETNKRILLAIDEYENLDRKLGEKVFPEDLLATIRESIQTHRNITWIFAGSHEITELKHAEWPSYLVSTRTIEVPMFTMAETRLLLTEPLKFSPLFKDESKRPRFEPGFWGEKGIERIQREAGGWPHLVQLIAETIIDVINDADQRQVDDELFETALNKAIISGHNVLYQLLRGECTLPGEWEYLSAFRARETQPLPGEEALYVSLRRRLLMEEVNGEWRLRVPLMARWLKQRG